MELKSYRETHKNGTTEKRHKMTSMASELASVGECSVVLDFLSKGSRLEFTRKHSARYTVTELLL